MWTIGRDREKESARKFLGSADSSLLEAVVDAVHDLLETGMVTDTTADAFRRGFYKGRAGTWESTGSWLVKTVPEYPSLAVLWSEFAQHASAVVRLRCAAFIRDMPADTARSVLSILLGDRSAKVRAKAAADQHDTKFVWVEGLLEDGRLHESDPAVLEAIEFALESIRNRAR